MQALFYLILLYKFIYYFIISMATITFTASFFPLLFIVNTCFSQVANNSKDSTTESRPYNSYMREPGVIKEDTSKVIGFAISSLYKKQPECPLGNFMADCMKLYGEKWYNRKVDAAFVNPSGMRSYIPKGDVKLGTIYKVMPYDNSIVLVKLKGEILALFLHHTAALGGWPCAGVTMGIKDKSAINILVGGEPLDENKIYTIAVSDYVAKGGNECTMLKGLPQANNHNLFRNALLEYVTSITKEGNPIDAKIEGRVVNEVP